MQIDPDHFRQEFSERPFKWKMKDMCHFLDYCGDVE